MVEELMIVFPDDYDERGEYEAERRGLLDRITVKVTNETFDLCFFTPTRIAVELQLLEEAGEPFIADPGLIVIQKVTRAAILDTVSSLSKLGYFQRLRPSQ